MPTPVTVARQCLADVAALSLDEAVKVAKKRCHAQTTSLHAVSALLFLPSSTLRDACTRARSSAYSPRLQFRALELCVGTALDRVSVSKSTAPEEPPVSNSLMAAIKRAQANQRRHPETFHLYQQQLNSTFQNSISIVKVELKHFIMSILDDPIVGRVFCDAGFRTNDIKMAIINPIPISSATSRYPPLFLRRSTDLDSNKRIPNFPFHLDDPAATTEKLDENSRRIGEILAKKDNRNPLLIGVCANDALKNFIDCLNKNGNTEFLPKLSVVSMEPEFVNEERIRLKLKQVGEMVENCQGSGILVNCGDLKALFVDDESSVDAINSIVSELKRLLKTFGGRLWVIGFLANDDDYKKLLEQFPSIEMDWDLHLLPITAASSSIGGGKCFKSSLMGSFVPFGGFFSLPSELETVRTSVIQPTGLCNFCNEKYEKEISVIQKGESTVAINDDHSVNPTSWLQIATSKRPDTVKVTDEKTVFEAKVKLLKTKWSDICNKLHLSGRSQEDISKAKLQFLSVPSTGLGTLLNRTRVNLSPCTPSSDLQKNFLSNQNNPKPQAESSVHGLVINNCSYPSVSEATIDLPIACSFPSSFVHVTTDLGLGTIYASSEKCARKINLQEHNIGIRDSPKCSGVHENENASSKVSQSSPGSHRFNKQMDMKDLGCQWNVLAEQVSWQTEAIQTIGRTILRSTDGNLSYHFSNKGNIWLSFLGPDKVAKRKVAAFIAEIVFGKQENLICFDLSLQDSVYPVNSVIDSCGFKFHDLNSGRKNIVDCIAEEVSKHPNSVMLLENIEKADFSVQQSLSQAVKTGKFQDCRGRDITVKNIVFVLASSVQSFGKNLPFGRVASEFPEEKILEAKNFQMQILIRYANGNYSPRKTANVSVISSKALSKRKVMDGEYTRAEILKRSCQSPRSYIDLNLPVEDTEEDSIVWLKEFLEHVDENIEFKPFDFDSLAKKFLKEIEVGLNKVVKNKMLLEIDRDVMVQILAAAWLTNRKDALEDWIEKVLCSSVEEARQRCTMISSNYIMQLVPCDGLVAEEQAFGVYLPARINVNDNIIR